MRIFSIIVTFNGKQWIEKCITSLLSSSFIPEIIVVDNGSVDGTQETIKQFSEIHFIQSGKNIGFGKANNIGIQTALEKKADYVFLLNQDAWVEKNTIESLINVAKKNPDYGIISPLHFDGSGTCLDEKFSNYLIPEKCHSFYSDLYFKKLKELYAVEFVNAAAWLISKACIEKVGLFEPMFFIYGEDNNYLQRTVHYKFKTGITPLCSICHDRSVRKGKFNAEGDKIFDRTQSLIILLNILNSYPKSVYFFLKEKIYLIQKSIYHGSLISFSNQLKDIFFLITHFGKIQKARKRYNKKFIKE